MTVHVVTGSPCAGKTIFARAKGDAVIDLDDIEEGFGGEPTESSTSAPRSRG